jgi:hypothetical protein
MQDHFPSDFADHVSLQPGEFWKPVRISKPTKHRLARRFFFGIGV